MRRMAAGFPGVAQGTSCNQGAFKAGRGTFLFIGPGPKGQGFKAMFKLEASRSQAQQLAARSPSRFEVGSTGWVTARFTTDDPLPAALWKKWLAESYELTCGTESAPRKSSRTRKPGRKA